MDSVRSRTSAAYRVASRAGPSPRAAGAPFQSGAAIPGSQHCHRPKDRWLIHLITATGGAPAA